MALDWNIVIYLLGVAVLWGSVQAEVKALRRDIERLDEKVSEHNHLQERMAVAEQNIKSVHHRLNNIAGEE